ncbi:MAG: TonB-dependent receptor plug domain-containing protein [Candidatus Omnitrophica bacterium]|nr:TonB-dependent receptor plug domain-containing protein [Candidatus Omnitrophota bacterium]
MKRKIFLLAMIALSSLLWAQIPVNAEDDNQKITSLEKIIVTQRGYYIDPVYYPLSVPSSEESTTSVVTAEEIQAAHKQTAIESIENVPDVILERQGRKYPTRIKIRGERNVNVLINGAPPGQDYRILGALPSTLIEEVDVIRDSSYLAYGSPNTSSSGGTPGYGGVVNIKLKRPEKESGTEVKLEYGNFNTQDESITNAGKLMDTSYLINIEHTASNGPNNWNANRSSTGFTTLLNKEYGDYGSRVNMLFHFDEGYFGFQKQMYFGTHTYDIWEYDPSMDTMVNLDILHAWNERTSTNITAYHDYQQATLVQNQNTKQSNYTPVKGGNDIQNRDITSGVIIRQTFSIPNLNTLRFGAQFNNWNCPTGKLFYEGSPRKEQDYGAYAHDEVRLLEDKLILDGGARWDRKYVGKGINYIESGGTSGTYTDKWLDPNINSAIGITIWPFEKHGFSTRYSISSQANAIYADANGSLLGNQTENRYDLSYIGKWSKKISFTLTGFQKDISNMPQAAGATPTDYYIATDVKRYGAELEIKGSLFEGFSYFVNFSQIYSRDETNQKRDSTIPPYVANIGLNYQHSGWEFNTTVKRVSGYEDNSLVQPSYGYVDIGDYWQGDINASYTFQRNNINHSIYTGIRNVGNVKYQTVPGYQDYGLTFYGGYRIKF